MITETLKQTNGNRELAAKLLGIASRTIYRKMGPQTGNEQNSAGNALPRLQGGDGSGDTPKDEETPEVEATSGASAERAAGPPDDSRNSTGS
jgi:hypothetical protein